MWPLILGPLLGLMGSVMLSFSSRIPHTPPKTVQEHVTSGALGLGVGTAFGLIVVLSSAIRR